MGRGGIYAAGSGARLLFQLQAGEIGVGDLPQGMNQQSRSPVIEHRSQPFEFVIRPFSGEFPLSPHDPAAPLTAEAVSLAFQRDGRRYDNGFPLY